MTGHDFVNLTDGAHNNNNNNKSEIYKASHSLKNVDANKVSKSIFSLLIYGFLTITPMLASIKRRLPEATVKVTYSKD